MFIFFEKKIFIKKNKIKKWPCHRRTDNSDLETCHSNPHKKKKSYNSNGEYILWTENIDLDD
jgi:hypothetical protein